MNSSCWVSPSSEDRHLARKGEGDRTRVFTFGHVTLHSLLAVAHLITPCKRCIIYALDSRFVATEGWEIGRSFAKQLPQASDQKHMRALESSRILAGLKKNDISLILVGN